MNTPDQHVVAFHARAQELGHTLQLNDEGQVDQFAMNTDNDGGHNGPACTTCHDFWCVWCTPVAAIKPCSCKKENAA